MQAVSISIYSVFSNVLHIIFCWINGLLTYSLSLLEGICSSSLSWFLWSINSTKISDLYWLFKAEYERQILQEPFRVLHVLSICGNTQLFLVGMQRSPWSLTRTERFLRMPGFCVSGLLHILIPSLLSNPLLLLENFPQCVLEISDHEVLEWFTAKDFIVGKPLTILGRTFFIYDCDPFTRQYYKEKFGIADLPPVDISKQEPPPVKQVKE